MANTDRSIDVRSEVNADLERTIRDLREFIDALDRRIPQVHKLGEEGIASAALMLRAQALARIIEIQRDMLA